MQQNYNNKYFKYVYKYNKFIGGASIATKYIASKYKDIDYENYTLITLPFKNQIDSIKFMISMYKFLNITPFTMKNGCN